ncbi:MAG: hypothetical protein V5A55_04615 [Halovenus sp.]
MGHLSRRQYLGVVAGTLGIGVAGCIDENPEFLVTNLEVIHQNGFGNVDYTYPDDMLVRVTIENEYPERREGTVVVVLEYAPDGEPIESWEEREFYSLGRGVSPQPYFVFPDAYRPGSDVKDYRAEGFIEQDE